MPTSTPPPTANEGPLEAAPPPALLRAVRRLLGPLVRLLLSHQVTFPVLTNLLKSVYVEQAEKGFEIPGRPQTISRLSLITGIHRKDIKRLQNLQSESAAEQETSSIVSLGAQLALRWTTDDAYLTTDGRPQSLPRLAGPDGRASFETLVESITQDIRPRAILDEWVRLGVARIDSEDRVHLVEEAFVPKHGFDEKAYYLGRNLRDHLDAARHNMVGGEDPLLERSVYYARLRPESVDELQTLSRELGMQALQQVNQKARQLQDRDESQSDAHHRMSFGVYFFKTQMEEQTDGSEDTEGDDEA